MLSETRWAAMLVRIWDSARLRRFLKWYLAIGVACAVAEIILGYKMSGTTILRDPPTRFWAVACIVAWPVVIVLFGVFWLLVWVYSLFIPR